MSLLYKKADEQCLKNVESVFIYFLESFNKRYYRKSHKLIMAD